MDVDPIDLADDLAALPPEADAVPVPADELAATRLLRAYARVERDLADLNGVFDVEAGRIEARRHDVTAGLRHRRAALIAALSDYHRAVLVDDPGRKTMHLPTGDLRSRAGRPRLVVDDDAVACEWLADAGYDDLVQTTSKVRRADAAKRFVAVEDDAPLSLVVDPESGEVVPGMHFDPAERSFWIEPAWPAPNREEKR